MKRIPDFGLMILLVAMLAAMDHYLGRQVAYFAGGLAALWFGISMVLLTRPPGIPEFVSEEVGSDEQHVVRKDVIPIVPMGQRIRLSLGVACGSCLLLWVSLALLAK